MTDQPMDYRDYLIRQHQQERMAQRVRRAVHEGRRSRLALRRRA